MKYCIYAAVGLVLAACGSKQPELARVQPKYVTDTVSYDSDDPAIWINKEDPANSLILGTDKQELDGGLYAFDLKGKKLTDRQAYPLDRPNNVDLAYDVTIGADTFDVAVVTERGKGQIRCVQSSRPDAT